MHAYVLLSGSMYVLTLRGVSSGKSDLSVTFVFIRVDDPFLPDCVKQPPTPNPLL